MEGIRMNVKDIHLWRYPRFCYVRIAKWSTYTWLFGKAFVQRVREEVGVAKTPTSTSNPTPTWTPTSPIRRLSPEQPCNTTRSLASCAQSPVPSSPVRCEPSCCGRSSQTDTPAGWSSASPRCEELLDGERSLEGDVDSLSIHKYILSHNYIMSNR